MSAPGHLRRDLAFVVGPHAQRFGLALGWTFAAATLLTLVNPLLTRWIFDVAVPGRQAGLLLGVAAVALVLLSGLRWLDYQYALFQQRLTNRMTTTLTARLLRAFYRLPAEQVAAHGEGYYAARTMSEVNEVVDPLVDMGVSLLRSVTVFVTALGTVLVLSWKLTLVLLLITPVLLLLSRYFAAHLHTNAQDVQERTARQQAVHTAAIAAYRATRTFGLEERAAAQVLGALGERLSSLYTLSRHTGLYQTLSRISLGVAEFAVVVAGGLAIIATSLTLGGLMAYMAAFWLAVNAAQSLIDLIPELSVLRAGIGRLRELDEAPGTPEQASGDLYWQGVSCGQGDVTVLEGVTVRVPQGSRTLICGPNGSGKSTLALTALGLLAPQLGTLTRPARVSGLVEPVVFPPLPLSDLLEGTDAVRREALVQTLGLDSLLHQPYSDLSLGQKKKVALLMTLLKPADLYVFDEPLANLDDDTQQLALELMLRETRGHTLLAVMHDAERVAAHFDLRLEVGGGEVKARPQVLNSATCEPTPGAFAAQPAPA
ncbi:ABC transporter transmembrane domain-containing protein [Deinococcus aquaedulcis]|uniref:ABC transporter transmembrane domain-containing protein n=1 Tax=Deinococcus aquaedulcis TaxID=2840455 RepID=UPI001C8402F8|nr:ABC transporter ATP-binding protein [Deinococcus aquaedulcis]